jgi:isopentenyl diphosphate isomerase/L-lactate dehydrogenase-like FMN-dependent dehydrogenase
MDVTDAASPVPFPTLAAVRRAAHAALDEHALAYLEGGAGAERTLRWNEEAFGKWAIRPRVCTGEATADTTCELFGVPLSMPIVVAPFGLDALFHPDGHRALVQGAAAAGTVAFASSSSAFPLEEVHAAAPGAAIGFQVSALGPVGVVERMAKRAADAGYRVLCMTVDTPRPGWRERTREDPDAPDAAALASANYGPEDYAARVRGAVGWTWDTVAGVGDAAGIPWVAKGVLTGADAHHAIDHGAAGVWVSNHGGRQLDGAPASLDALPEVVDAVGGRAPVLVDGGVRHGSDVLVALALGATAVGIGRPAAWGLTAAGADGVARVLDLLREEYEITRTLAGGLSVAR